MPIAMAKPMDRQSAAQARTTLFEFISEGRIELIPGVRPYWSPVGCLMLVDAYVEKLLSKSDRWREAQLLADLEGCPLPGETS